ncbi:MAG: site-specific DNA-methyltransferase [Bacteroides oleiciplenus]|jgi:site-specific DNA-methyltransferase (adenine-specific)|nr:MAG: site-specific DNA-methyltransferase [Bacteroides oleiciplenus]
MPIPYYSTNDSDFCLYLGDTVEELELMKGEFDMIFADPPYFLSTGNGKVNINGQYIKFDKGDWDRVRSSKEKDKFNTAWLSQCYRKLKDEGTIWISGTYHNVFSIANCLENIGFKILNIVVWHKFDPPCTLSEQRLNFSAEYIIWANKRDCKRHYFNYELLKSINSGVPMPDVWTLPAVDFWEKHCGKHPTQKPLCLLYRIILASTRQGSLILDPFAGSCTTGIAANLLGRKFVGIDQSKSFLDLGIRRRQEISVPAIAQQMRTKMAEIPEEVMVMVNHARRELREKMIETGICYLRAGDSKGSLLVTPGFERMHYVLLHTNGEECSLYKLKIGGHFQIWTKETLEQHGFHPQHAPYYIVLLFDKNNPIEFKVPPNLKESINTYRAKIRPLSHFIGLI